METKAEDIRKLLARRPFTPFVLSLSNGERFEVTHPEVLLIQTRISAVSLIENGRQSLSVFYTDEIVSIDIPEKWGEDAP
ncbi:MAG: hypothetical protein HY720_10655 [Planctomycetes bacterium]|nr:hypothetical protein [Planctomycetota bacterium]